MLYCLCQKASCQNAFQRQALMSFPSKQSITHKYLCGKCWMCCPFHFPWKFLRWHVVIWRSYCELKRVGKAASVSQGWISEGSPWFLISSSVFATKKKKHLKSSVDCPKEFKRSQVRVTLWDLCVAHQMPCFSQASRAGGRRGQAWGLSEQLPDLSMNVAKEVHVGSSTVQAFILHQELTEHHLWFVLLPHDLELRGVKVRESQKMSSVSSMNLFKFTMLLFF